MGKHIVGITEARYTRKGDGAGVGSVSYGEVFDPSDAADGELERLERAGAFVTAADSSVPDGLEFATAPVPEGPADIVQPVVVAPGGDPLHARADAITATSTATEAGRKAAEAELADVRPVATQGQRLSAPDATVHDMAVTAAEGPITENPQVEAQPAAEAASEAAAESEATSPSTDTAAAESTGDKYDAPNMLKDALVKEANKRKLEVTRSDGKSGEPTADDYRAALRANDAQG